MMWEKVMKCCYEYDTTATIIISNQLQLPELGLHKTRPSISQGRFSEPYPNLMNYLILEDSGRKQSLSSVEYCSLGTQFECEVQIKIAPQAHIFECLWPCWKGYVSRESFEVLKAQSCFFSTSNLKIQRMVSVTALMPCLTA